MIDYYTWIDLKKGKPLPFQEDIAGRIHPSDSRDQIYQTLYDIRKEISERMTLNRDFYREGQYVLDLLEDAKYIFNNSEKRQAYDNELARQYSQKIYGDREKYVSLVEKESNEIEQTSSRLLLLLLGVMLMVLLVATFIFHLNITLLIIFILLALALILYFMNG